MSIAYLSTACIESSRVVPVRVEVDIQPGLPYFSIIGLPDKRIEEAKERVRAAIKNSGFSFPLGKITVNLAPSSVRKQGTGFDLAIALGILAATGLIVAPENCWVLGELSLSGNVQAYQQLVGVLVEAKRKGVSGCMIPEVQKLEAQLVHEVPVLRVRTLKEAASHCMGMGLTFTFSHPLTFQSKKEVSTKLDVIRGRAQAKRMLQIALAGRHNLLLIGPAGSGKTALVQAAAELQPSLRREELLQNAQIYAYAGMHFSFDNPTRPFRMPLPSLTRPTLLGGGNPLVPGEMSLAHNGILFLDEFAEINNQVREALRVPLQEKSITHVRRAIIHRFLANTQLIAAMNSCPCGKLGTEGESCTCTPGDRAKYRATLPDPLLDRFQLVCLLDRVEESDAGISAQEFAASVEQAFMRKTPTLPLEERKMLETAQISLKLSGRAREAVESVAGTIAKLAGSAVILSEHIHEALQYRRRSDFL